MPRLSLRGQVLSDVRAAGDDNSAPLLAPADQQEEFVTFQRAGESVRRALEECAPPGMSAADVIAAIEEEAADEAQGEIFDGTHRGSRFVITRGWVVVLRRHSPRPVDVCQIGQVVEWGVRHHVEYVGNNERVEMATLELFARRRRAPLTLTLPREQVERMRGSFLARLSAAQAAIRAQTEHAALALFRAAVAGNGAAAIRATAPPPECMGCAIAPAAVKISKRCQPGDGSLSCCVDRRNCCCAPAWCVDCLGKWWLSTAPPALQLAEGEAALAALAAEVRATCPTCRVAFCLRDCVPLVVEEEQPAGAD